MNTSVLIEPCAVGVRVSTGSPLNIVAEAATESQAMEDAKTRYREKLSTGARLAPLSLDADRYQHSLDNLAGIPDDEWEKFQSAVREYRESCDARDEATPNRHAYTCRG